MKLPEEGDYIDIHTHGAKRTMGIFAVENIMAHEERTPENVSGFAFTFGIHPWFLNDSNHNYLICSIKKIVGHPDLIAIGEAGFDKIKGPAQELQRKTFEEQVIISEEYKKPVIIHCVRAWDELLLAHKKLSPEMPWLIHGFRGNIKLAAQLLSKGMYLSFWFDFITRSESAELLRNIPSDRIFLETDGAEINIEDIYRKVSIDLNLSVEELKSVILSNFKAFFKISLQ
jgi:TatD DNase family protein